MIFRPKKKVVMAKEIVKDIKSAIVNGQIKNGEKLVETKIARLMGISRSPVRDALKQLEKEGIVVNIPYKGAFVNILSIEDVESMYELRAVLEAYAIEKVIKSKSKREMLIKRLRLIMDDMEEAVLQKNLEIFAKKDVEFHRNICHFSNNKKLIEIWESFQNQIEILIKLESSFYERLKLSTYEHEELLSLILEGKIKEAQEKDKVHIIQALEFLKKGMKLNDRFFQIN